MPVTSATDAPVSTAAMAEEGEVLPMPISPAASRVTPRAASSRAMSMPACRQASASSRVMAGPSLKSRAACMTLRRTRPSTSSRSFFIPTSTTVRRAPALRQKAFIVPPPLTKLRTCISVTSCPVALTPWRAMSWSAANSTTDFSGNAGHARSVIPASRTASSSSWPRLLGTLARLSRRCCAASAAFAENAGIVSVFMGSSDVFFMKGFATVNNWYFIS